MLRQGLIVKLLLQKVIAKRGGLLPLFATVIGDDPSDDYMFDVSDILFFVSYCVTSVICSFTST